MAPEAAAGGLGESTDEPREVGRRAGSFRREDVSFSSAGELCAGWLYIPQGLGPHPAVILAHGLGGQRRFRLDAYGERFAEAGMAALVFDYRHFAESDGEPRQLVSIGRQLEDWRAALRFARGHSLVAPRIALWGTSLSAGHVQAIAAEDHEIAAVIAQVPLVNGRSVARTVGPRQAIRLIWAAYRDRLRALLGRDAYRIPIWGPPGTLAAMTAPGAAEAIRTKLLPPGDWDETMPARILASLSGYYPGRRAGRITCPILYQVAEHDRITPPGPALQAARLAPKSVLRGFPIDHFDIYTGQPFEQAVREQIVFLRRHLAINEERDTAAPPPDGPVTPA